eukprot:scaffold23.g4096.t1
MHKAELLLHAGVTAWAAATLAWRGYRFSLQFEEGGTWDGHAPGLRPGSGPLRRRVDLSDIQWRDFRGGMLPLALALGAFALLSRLLAPAPRAAAAPPRAGGGGAAPATATSPLATRRQLLSLGLALAYIGYLHGACSFFVLGLVLSSWRLSHAVAGRRHGALVIWGANLAALLAARLAHGVRFASLAAALAPLDAHRGQMRWEICFNLTLLRLLSFGLDLHWRQLSLRGEAAPAAAHFPPLRGERALAASAGAQPLDKEQRRWEGQPAAAGAAGERRSGGAGAAAAGARAAEEQAGQGKGVAGAAEPAAALAAAAPGKAGGRPGGDAAREAARWRQRTPLPSLDDYRVLPCLAYCLYPPLYLAGPIITFQDWAWQLRAHQRPPVREASRAAPPLSWPLPAGARVLRYAARFAADWACLELLTRTLYFNSIAKHRVGLRLREHGLQYGPVEIGATGFWVLCFMWLKFATIWRFFRRAHVWFRWLGALLEGVAPPDNMQRCFANNYDIEGFWKGWHSSYNQARGWSWLVRYLYVPLGGARTRLLNIWPIFLFVAVWHDLEWRLIAWAWLVCLAFVPELLAKRLAAAPALDRWRSGAAFRHATAAAAALNISGLMAANLAGFVLDLAGLAALSRELAADPRFLATALCVFYCAAHLMFWLRRERGAAK